MVFLNVLKKYFRPPMRPMNQVNSATVINSSCDPSVSKKQIRSDSELNDADEVFTRAPVRPISRVNSGAAINICDSKLNNNLNKEEVIFRPPMHPVSSAPAFNISTDHPISNQQIPDLGLSSKPYTAEKSDYETNYVCNIKRQKNECESVGGKKLKNLEDFSMLPGELPCNVKDDVNLYSSPKVMNKKPEFLSSNGSCDKLLKETFSSPTFLPQSNNPFCSSKSTLNAASNSESSSSKTATNRRPRLLSLLKNIKAVESSMSVAATVHSPVAVAATVQSPVAVAATVQSPVAVDSQTNGQTVEKSTTNDTFSQQIGNETGYVYDDNLITNYEMVDDAGNAIANYYSVDECYQTNDCSADAGFVPGHSLADASYVPESYVAYEPGHSSADATYVPEDYASYEPGHSLAEASYVPEDYGVYEPSHSSADYLPANYSAEASYVPEDCVAYEPGHTSADYLAVDYSADTGYDTKDYLVDGSYETSDYLGVSCSEMVDHSADVSNDAQDNSANIGNEISYIAKEPNYAENPNNGSASNFLKNDYDRLEKLQLINEHKRSSLSEYINDQMKNNDHISPKRSMKRVNTGLFKRIFVDHLTRNITPTVLDGLKLAIRELDPNNIRKDHLLKKYKVCIFY